MATKVFEGKYKNSSDQIYLIDKGRFYKGKYSNSSDELKNIVNKLKNNINIPFIYALPTIKKVE